MRILVDIGHPAHVHYFKHFVVEMQSRGHELLVTARDRELVHYLLERLDIPFVDRGRGGDSIPGKAAYLVLADIRMARRAFRFRPDVFLSVGSPYAAHAAALTGRPHIALDDTESARIGQLLYRPFSAAVLSPDTFGPDFGRKHVKFPGYMELCHLHPDRFRPDPELVREAGVDPDRPYTVMRFVGWRAAHDLGHRGLSDATKVAAARAFGERGEVFISSEGPLPPALEECRAAFPPEIVHHVLAFARLCWGESATMASEAAVLGTPAVYLDDEGRGYTREQEEAWGLVFNFGESAGDQEAAIEKGRELLEGDPEAFARKREAMLAAKIDVTSFLVWFVESWPESLAAYPAVLPDGPGHA